MQSAKSLTFSNLNIYIRTAKIRNFVTQGMTLRHQTPFFIHPGNFYTSADSKMIFISSIILNSFQDFHTPKIPFSLYY